jgi:hypothetical protein
MEELKKLEEITLPDSRNTHYVLINRQTGQQRKYRLEDLHVRSQFNVARNISLYSWFCYPFHNIADMKTFSTLEMALRVKLKKQNTRTSLFHLIGISVKQGLIKDKHFSHIRAKLTNLESTCYVESLPKLISSLRNNWAHGSTMLYDASAMNLRICADFINQIFDKTKNNPEMKE